MRRTTRWRIKLSSRQALLEEMLHGCLRGEALRFAFSKRWIHWESERTERLLDALEITSENVLWDPACLRHVQPRAWLGEPAADEAFFMVLLQNDAVTLDALGVLEAGLGATLLEQHLTWERTKQPLEEALLERLGPGSMDAVRRFLVLFDSELEERFTTLGAVLDWVATKPELREDGTVALLAYRRRPDEPFWEAVAVLHGMSAEERSVAVSLRNAGSTASLQELAVLVQRL